MYRYIHITCSALQANSKNSTGCVRLDINLLKPTRIEFAENPAPSVSLPDGHHSSPKWLEYVYRTAHPVLRWLPTKLAEWIGEELKLPISGPMERAGVIKLYEPLPTPCLYVAPAANMIGRVPLIPLFLAGNSTPTIPHQYSRHKRSGFPVGSCDSAAADGQRGSHVYEVNPWLWQFGRGKPRLGGLSVEKTGAKKAAAQKERLLRGAETRRRRKADRA